MVAGMGCCGRPQPGTDSVRGLAARRSVAAYGTTMGTARVTSMRRLNGLQLNATSRSKRQCML